MSKLIYAASRPTRKPREPQWWWKLLRTGSLVERDGQQWELTEAWNGKFWSSHIDD